jgi:2-methylcitrate dehydratase PrpD
VSEQLNALWQRYGRLTLDEVPAEARAAACQCILDWLGVTFAGSTEPLARILRAEFAPDHGPATVIGSSQRVPAKAAALINGATGHALDFDDTNLFGGHHATAALLPAALALAEETGVPGADLLTAYIAGVEVTARMRVVIGDEHYRQGWHITSTLGVYGAVAAAGWLMKLDTDQFGSAVGLASSQVGGVHANFGTMTKPFHAGFAAERGLLSAGLARRGFTANPDAFERAFRQMSGDINWGRIADRSDEWAVIDTNIKRFVSGHGTQATILATHSLVEKGLTAHDIVQAEVRTAETVPHTAYGVRVPRDGLQSKFSLPGVCALVLLGHDLTIPASYSDENVASPAFADLIGRIELVGDPRFGEGTGEIVVQTRSGDTITEPLPFTRYSGTVESKVERVNHKFASLATPVIGDDAAKRLRDMVLDLAALPSVEDLCDLTRTS